MSLFFEIFCNCLLTSLWFWQTLAQVFSCEFCEISKNAFCYRTPQDDCFCKSEELTSRSSRPEVFLGKGVLKICAKFMGEHPCQSGISIQSNFIEITLRHRCSIVNLLHFFRTAFPKNSSKRLLLISVKNLVPTLLWAY